MASRSKGYNCVFRRRAKSSLFRLNQRPLIMLACGGVTVHPVVSRQSGKSLYNFIDGDGGIADLYYLLVRVQPIIQTFATSVILFKLECLALVSPMTVFVLDIPLHMYGNSCISQPTDRFMSPGDTIQLVVGLAFGSMLAASDEDEFPKRNKLLTACHVTFGGGFVLCFVPLLAKTWSESQQYFVWHHTIVVRICTMTKSRALNTMVLLKSAKNRL